MTSILVSGLINVETTLRIDSFPLAYNPVNYPFFGINTTVSGVGFNVAKALTVLGDDVRLCSLIGRDLAGGEIRTALTAAGLDDRAVLAELEATPQSVILYDVHGRRQIHTDLKDIQGLQFPPAQFDRALHGCAIAALCNINFARPLLPMARRAGIPIATDVHAISRLDDEYNADFMAAADILFMSGDLLPAPPEEWAAAVIARYQPRILVIGLGRDGALLAVPDADYMGRTPALPDVRIVSTVGAGDALFAAFLHAFAQTPDPHRALRRAIVFAGHKIGAAAGGAGFLTAAELDALAADFAP